MRFSNWLFILGLVFFLISATVYSIHYLIFKDPIYIGKYFLVQLAFLPINVLLVTLVINRLISKRAKREKEQKLNLIIGVFFSDIGTDLLRILTQFDLESQRLKQELQLNDSWNNKDFLRANKIVENANFQIRLCENKLEDLKSYLFIKRTGLQKLLESPILFEHDSFSNMLRSVYHIIEELELRKELSGLSASDIEHLESDIKRAYKAVLLQWLNYSQHLKKDYDYMFSLVIRTNPFYVSNIDKLVGK